MEAEGVVKYQLEHLNKPLAPELVPMELIATRNRLFEAGLIGQDAQGYGYGNISVRVGQGEFVVSGTQTGHLPTADVQHFACIHQLEFERNFLRSSGPVAPSSEALTHGMIYRTLEDIAAVIHVHHEVAWSALCGQIPTTSAKVAYGTLDMANEVERLVNQPCGTLAMAGHDGGLIAWGTSLSEAEQTLLQCVKAWL